MATSNQSVPLRGPNAMKAPTIEPSELQISRYEQVASWLISFLAVTGVITGALLLVWWGSTNRYRPPAYALTMEEEEGFGRGDHPKGFARDDKAPGDPDRPILDEPAGTELFEVMEPMSDLSFVAEAATTTVAEFGDIAVTANVTESRSPGFRGKGGGEGGLGDNRPEGPLGDGVYVIPRYERWEMRFTSSSRGAYAGQLDFFRIELAAIGKKPLIDYAFNLSKSKPETKSGPSKGEKRLYMSWKGGALQAFDRGLLQAAGIDTDGRLLVQFYPPEVESILEGLEKAGAGGRSKRQYLKTVFGVRSNGRGFEFYVIEQRFR